MRRILVIIFCFSLSITTGFGQNDSDSTWRFIVKDSSQYNKEFINYWKHVYPFDVLFSKDSIIIGKKEKDVVIIPTDLSLKKTEHYECSIKDTNYLLEVKRINYTNIEFELTGFCNKQNTFHRKGVAILEHSFHLGAEGVYEKEGEYYGMNDYNFEVDGIKGSLVIPAGTLDVIDYWESHPVNFSLRFKNKKATQ